MAEEARLTKNDKTEPTEAEVATQARHFMVLLATIVSIELAQVILGPALYDTRLVGWLQVIIICVTIYAVGGKRNLTIAALILGGPVLLARVVSVSITAKEAELVTLSLGLVFTSFVIWVIGAAVARPGRVSMDKIYGAICVYLLLGMAWGHAYCVLEIAEPGSFSFPERAAYEVMEEQSDYRDLEHELGFYSYVTLTTLGYGDITPVSRRAQQLSWLEAVFGQLFIAITIAGLVGAQIAYSRDDDG